jgi:hypothetical protein
MAIGRQDYETVAVEVIEQPAPVITVTEVEETEVRQAS